MGFRIHKWTKPENITPYTYKNKPITLEKIPGNFFRPSDYIHWRKNVYPVEVQNHAAVMYAVTGDIKKASEIAKVDPKVLRKWLKEAWFHEVIQEVRQENKGKYDAKLSEILDSAVEKLKERIEEGDISVNFKTGQQVTVPVKAKDLANIATAVHKQRSLERGDPTSIVGNQGNAQVADRLKDLATAFENLTNERRKQRIIEQATLDISDAEIVVPEQLEPPKNEQTV